MKKIHVVSCILKYKDKILILKRSDKVGTYKGKWQGVAGYLEGNPLEQAKIEIREEVGLSDIELLKEGKVISVPDNQYDIIWMVHPYLFKVNTDKIKIDWEHIDYKWVNPEDIGKYGIVPNLKEVIKELMK